MAKTAYVFPGQGSQKIGMLAEFAANFDIVKETFDEASAVLGYDLWSLSQNGQESEIAKTEVTQPLLLTASTAIWRVAKAHDMPAPDYVAGHSLGEWSALVAADVVSFADAVKAVQLRGRYMQDAVAEGEGAMAAVIGLSDEQIDEVINQLELNGECLQAVNYNAPGQVVVAGHKGAIDKAIVALKEAGAKRALPLAVSAPFHTSLMEPAAKRLQEHLQSVTFSTPSIPVVHNVHAKTESNAEAIKSLMLEQIYSPVLWVGCVSELVNLGVDTVYECGAGNVLAGLIKRIDRSIKSQSLESLEQYK